MVACRKRCISERDPTPRPSEHREKHKPRAGCVYRSGDRDEGEESQRNGSGRTKPGSEQHQRKRGARLTSSERESVVLLPDGSPRGVVVEMSLSDTPVLLSDGGESSGLPVLVDTEERNAHESKEKSGRESRDEGARRNRVDERLRDPVDSGVSSDGLVRRAGGWRGRQGTRSASWFERKRRGTESETHSTRMTS
jgi:hypothetical protein